MPVALQRLWIRLTSDRRRFGLLIGCALLGMLLWARIIVISNPPRTAVAGEQHTHAAGEATKEGGQQQQHSPTTGRQPTPSKSEAALQPAIPVALATQPTRDPFEISPQFFPRPTFPTPTHPEPAKLPTPPAEDALRGTQLRTAAILAAAERLKLEAVMKGAQLAVIDGRTTRVGERIVAGKDAMQFVLVEVSDRSVVLECESRRIEVRMPGTMGENNR